MSCPLDLGEPTLDEASPQVQSLPLISIAAAEYLVVPTTVQLEPLLNKVGTEIGVGVGRELACQFS